MGALLEVLRTILAHLTDKGQGPNPGVRRPIGVLARLYRLWAAARRKEVRSWRRNLQNDWAWGSKPRQ
eukprot:12149301-Alexandrium_andersonii.AAC.1